MNEPEFISIKPDIETLDKYFDFKKPKVIDQIEKEKYKAVELLLKEYDLFGNQIADNYSYIILLVNHLQQMGKEIDNYLKKSHDDTFEREIKSIRSKIREKKDLKFLTVHFKKSKMKESVHIESEEILKDFRRLLERYSYWKALNIKEINQRKRKKPKVEKKVKSGRKKKIQKTGNWEFLKYQLFPYLDTIPTIKDKSERQKAKFSYKLLEISDYKISEDINEGIDIIIKLLKENR